MSRREKEKLLISIKTNYYVKTKKQKQTILTIVVVLEKKAALYVCLKLVFSFVFMGE